MQRRLISVGAIVLALVLFLALNVLSRAALGPVRIDLTEDGLYTLTEGTRSVLSKLEEPIHAKLYFTSEVARDFPPQLVGFDVKSFGTRVEETLEELANVSGGMFEVEVIDPEPFSEEEDEASAAGLSGIPAPGGDVLYFGLVLTNTVGDREVIPLLDGRRESFLEYELARRVHSLSQTEPPTIGLITTLPMGGGQYDPMTRQPPEPPWVVLQQLRSLFDVQELGVDIEEIPGDVDALLVVHPRELPDSTRYAIDQFVLAGGPAVVFVDPQCLEDMPPPDPSNPMSQYMQTPGSSDLPDLFRAWGVRLAPGVVAADRNHALMRQGSYERGAPAGQDYVVWMRLSGEECLVADQPATGMLSQLWIAQGGELEAIAGATTTFTPLVRTSDEGSRITASKVTLLTQADDLMEEYVASGTPLTIAALLTGPAKTAFPEGKPGAAEPEGEEATEPDSGGPDPGQLTESTGDIRVVVVSDADMLNDWLSYTERRLGPISLGWEKRSDNGDLLLNVIEQLAGSEDLIAIRGRGNALRPFEVVEEIRHEAEARYQEKEDELQARLDEANEKLRELQGESDGRGGIILTPEQEAEIERFRQDRVQIRKELRDLLHDKDRDIERLGVRIKLVNWLVMPALVLGAGLLFWGIRVGSRKKG